jgi:hypothetical protein
MATEEIVFVEVPSLGAPMAFQYKELAILPCCETQGVLWGRSALGEEWAECGTCGKQHPGNLTTDDKQRGLWAAIDKRKTNHAAKAA